MAQQPGILSQRANHRWGRSQGLLLLLLNVGFFFNLEYWLEGNLGWPESLQVNFGLQVLLYFLLSFLIGMLIGILRGRSVDQAGAVLHHSVQAEWIGIVPIIVLYELLGFLVAGVMVSGLASRIPFIADLLTQYFASDFAGIALIALGLSYVPILGGLQLLVGAGGGKLGWLLGSHFLHPRLASE
jgi:hypothetical protein